MPARSVLAAALAALVLALGPALARAGDGPARLDAFLTDLHSLRAHFEQQLLDENLEPLERSSGTLLVERPGRFRWDYAEPYPQLIVGDGERVWIFDRDLEQVTVKPMGRAIGGTPAVLLSSERPVAESFAVTDLGAQGSVAWVGLAPKAEDATFTEIRIGFDGERLASMELVDGFGQLTRIDFSDVSRNPAIDASLFRFDPPEGVDVLEAH